jgi:hypothetical protein
MASFVKFNCFVEDLAEKVHNLGSDTLKCLLTNTAPNAADTHVDTTTTPCEVHPTSGAVEVAAFTGYSKGGPSVTITYSAQSSGTYKLVGTDIVITNSSGGDSGSFRYVVLYNDSSATTSTRGVIGSWDYGSSILLHNGETFTIDFDGTNGILQIA